MKVAIVAIVVCLATSMASTATASAATVGGTVQAGGRAAQSWNVGVWSGGTDRAAQIATGTTDTSGNFSVTYPDASGAQVLYVIASKGEKRLMGVLGPPASALGSLLVTEQTTVGSVYPLARFLDGSAVSGPSPGLPNAVAGIANLVETRNSKVSFILSNSPNGLATEALPTFNTLANALASCTAGDHGDCEDLFDAAAPPRGPEPRNTIAALQALALNPGTRPTTIQALSEGGPFKPALEGPPNAWTLALLFTGGGMNAPGRMAFDHRGRIWVGNNFQTPGTEAGLAMTVLSPAGQPILASPIVAGGLAGVGYGTAVDRLGRIWQANFSGSSMSLFDDTGAPLANSPFGQATTSKPQGVAIDQKDNVWVANFGNDTVTVYRGGDPTAAPQVISGGGIEKPFDISHDAAGNAYVSNGAEAVTAGSVTRISPDGLTLKKITAGAMRSLQGIATDSAGNAWTAALASKRVVRVDPQGRTQTIKADGVGGPWGIAVDGEDKVWVAGFLNTNVALLCGQREQVCPPGVETGERISPKAGYTSLSMEHITAVQIDSSGNVWLANNWTTGSALKNFVGGNGLVQLVGAAAPVKTPKLGPPQQP